MAVASEELEVRKGMVAGFLIGSVGPIMGHASHSVAAVVVDMGAERLEEILNGHNAGLMRGGAALAVVPR